MSKFTDGEMAYYVKELENLSTVLKSIQQLENNVLELREEKLKRQKSLTGARNFVVVDSVVAKPYQMSENILSFQTALTENNPSTTNVNAHKKPLLDDRIIALSPSESSSSLFLLTASFKLQHVSFDKEPGMIVFEKNISTFKQFLFLKAATINETEVAMILFLDSSTSLPHIMLVSSNYSQNLRLPIQSNLTGSDISKLVIYRGISSKRTFVIRLEAQRHEKLSVVKEGYIVYCLRYIWFLPATNDGRIILQPVPITVSSPQGDNMRIASGDTLISPINALFDSSNSALVFISLEDDIKSILNACLVLNDDNNPMICAKHQMCSLMYPQLLCYARLEEKHSGRVVKIFLTPRECHIMEPTTKTVHKNEMLNVEKNCLFKTMIVDEKDMTICLVSEFQRNEFEFTQTPKKNVLMVLKIESPEAVNILNYSVSLIERVELETIAAFDLCAGFVLNNKCGNFSSRFVTTSKLSEILIHAK